MIMSSAVRSLDTELAIAGGKSVSQLLWDIVKFFDSIDPSQLVEEGVATRRVMTINHSNNVNH